MPQDEKMKMIKRELLQDLIDAMDRIQAEESFGPMEEDMEMSEDMMGEMPVEGMMAEEEAGVEPDQMMEMDSEGDMEDLDEEGIRSLAESKMKGEKPEMMMDEEEEDEEEVEL